MLTFVKTDRSSNFELINESFDQRNYAFLRGTPLKDIISCISTS